MNHLLLFLTLFASHLTKGLFIEANSDGFSVEIFHRDSKISPFYNPSATPDELAINAAIDSAARANHFAHAFNGSKFTSPLTRTGNAYLLKLSIGSPPMEAIGHLDTGSDVVWVQCQPCTKCQKQNLPFFDPAKSTTYQKLPCSSNYCNAIEIHQCGPSQECVYGVTYSSRETTTGVVATDTVTLHSTTGQDLAFPNTVFGCGTNNNMRFQGVETGIFGFTMGETSLVRQLGNGIQNRFAYCLLPKTSTTTVGKLKFGADAILSGPGVVTTSLFIKKPLTLYIINLESITIGDETIIYDVPTPAGPGNMLSDSGTTLNHLENSYYPKVEAALRKVIPLAPVVPPLTGFKLCYDKVSFDSTVPEFKFVYHLTGADITPKRYNLFYYSSNVVCFATVPGQVNIYGSNAQINFIVSHDLANNKISFAPADCTNF